MAKSKKTLIILLCVLVLAAAAYIISTEISKRKAAEETGTRVGALAGDLGHLTLTANGETNDYTFDKAANKWVLDADAEFPLRPSPLNTIFNKMKALTASRVFEATEGPAYYGFEEPLYAVSAVDDGGQSLSLLIGNALDDERYYATEPGGTTVYIVSTEFADALDQTLLGMASVDSLPKIDKADVTELDITSEGLPQHLFSRKAVGDGYERFVRTPVQSSTGQLDDGNEAITKSFDDLLGYVSDLSVESAAGWKVTDTQAAAYGLSAPYAVMSVSYDGSKTGHYTLTVGALDEEGVNRYCRIDDSNMIVTVRATFLDRVITNAAAIAAQTD